MWFSTYFSSSKIFNSISNDGTIDTTHLCDDLACSDAWHTSASILNNENDCAYYVNNNLSEDSMELVQTNIHEGSDSVSISMEVYKKLCQASVDLLKANKTIDKLNGVIRKKDAEIEKLKEEILNPCITPVSC